MTRPVASALPLVAVVAGIAISALRFRAGDSIGGIAAGLGGMLLMIVLAVVLERGRGASAKSGSSPRRE